MQDCFVVLLYKAVSAKKGGGIRCSLSRDWHKQAQYIRGHSSLQFTVISVGLISKQGSVNKTTLKNHVSTQLYMKPFLSNCGITDNAECSRKSRHAKEWHYHAPGMQWSKHCCGAITSHFHEIVTSPDKMTKRCVAAVDW